MYELKPCPFCGKKPRLIANQGVRVMCPNCYATTRILSDSIEIDTNAINDVVTAWNQRVPYVGWPGVKTDK